MAFVFRSPRITNLSQIESNADTLPKEQNNSSVINSTSSLLSSNNQSHKIQAPFGIFAKKNAFNNSKEDIPGPGAYELSKSLIKNKFNKNDTSPDEDNSSSGKNKRLFISKKERLDKHQYETDVPGPGKYFSDKNKRKFNKYNTMNKSNWIKPEKIINYEPFSTSRVLSIPSKGIDFGYELNNKGELILSEDPEKDNKFFGTKNDSVGPGQYNSEAYDKRNTKIGILDWNKSVSSTKSKKKTEDKNINNLSQYESSNYFFCSNTTEPTTNNNSISIINYNKKNRTKNYFYNGWDLDRNNFEIKFSNNKIYKNDNFAKTINRNNLSPFFKPDINPKTDLEIGNKTEFSENKNYNYFSMSSFSPKTLSENQQFFGSTLSRGIMFPKMKINNNNKLGRNEFENGEKFDIVAKTLNLSSSASSNIKKNLNLKSEKKKNKIIIKKIDKAEFIREISKSLKKGYSSNPGPGSYDPQLIPKNNYPYEIGNFGSLERRFPIYKQTNQEGGVLSYLYLDNWGPKTRTSYLKKVIPHNILKKLNEGISKNKMNIFREKIMKESRKQPPLGTYDVEKINTIESKVKNNAIVGKNVPAFGTSSKRILIEGQFNRDKDIGIGDFPQEKENDDKIKNIRQKYVPFLSNTRRDDMDNFEKERISKMGGKIGGPGYYKTDSYFDWNKKSYNILFN